jgi:predicted membrane protein
MSTPSSHTSVSPSRRHRRPDGRVTDLGRLLLGLCVVALGTLLLLGAAGVLDAGRAIDRWWPLVLVAAGLFTLAERPPAVARGLLLTAAGATLLLFTTDTVDEDAWAYVWPAAIIVAGLAILARWSGRAIALPDSATEDDVVRSTAIFSGPRIISSAQRFRGGWLTAVFGGVTLDLRSARLAPDGASINATAAFGGIEILVPRGWRITIRSTPIFGGAEDKTDRTTPPADDAPTLRIDAVCVFGGVDVKHEK